VRELEDLVAVVNSYREALDRADLLAETHGYGHRCTDPVQEIAARVPVLLSTLSADARALLREQINGLWVTTTALDEVIGHEPHLRLVDSA